MVGGREDDVAVHFDDARRAIAHREIEERVRLVAEIGVVRARVVVDPHAQAVTPQADVHGLQRELRRVAVQAELDGRRLRIVGIGGGVIHDAHDHRRAAAVEEEVPHREAESTEFPESAEFALVLAEAGDDDRFVDRSARRASDEGGHRGGHTDDRADSARHLLDVDARIREL